MDHANIAHGTPEAYREYIHEMLEGAHIHADLGMRYAAIGDDVGLGYALRRLRACMRAALTTFKDLRDMEETYRE
jgi:hypothetical protein